MLTLPSADKKLVGKTKAYPQIVILLYFHQMAVLFNSRYERFAQGVVQGYSHTDAYIRAGYSANGANANAARLIAIDSIRMRIEELQSCTAMLANTNAATMLFELEAARIAAMNSHSYLAAVKAIDSKMKLLAINKKANLEEK